jgi:hypothetical protein
MVFTNVDVMPFGLFSSLLSSTSLAFGCDRLNRIRKGQRPNLTSRQFDGYRTLEYRWLSILYLYFFFIMSCKFGIYPKNYHFIIKSNRLDEREQF